MYITDLIHSACVELSVNLNFQHAALELIADLEVLLANRLFLYIYVFNDICCRL